MFNGHNPVSKITALVLTDFLAEISIINLQEKGRGVMSAGAQDLKRHIYETIV
jgi:hypothetical protein